MAYWFVAPAVFADFLSVNLDPVDSIITKRDATVYGISPVEAPISGS